MNVNQVFVWKFVFVSLHFFSFTSSLPSSQSGTSVLRWCHPPPSIVADVTFLFPLYTPPPPSPQRSLFLVKSVYAHGARQV